MTRFVKFMKNSLTSTQRKIGFRNSNDWLYKNRLKCLIDNEYEIDQWKQLTTKMSSNRDYRYENDQNRCRDTIPILFGVSFPLFGFFEKKEKDSELITMIKRSILLIQKQEYKKAEQMLHLALRMAQTEKNEDGITYVYDIMANLAFDVGDYNKAQKLYKAVMQRILAAGAPQDDLRIVSMSLKLAKIFEHKRDFLNAENGYKYCLNILKEHINKGTEDDDIMSLWEINLDWYAHMLLSVSRFTEAMKYMEEAYILSVKHNGEVHEQSVILLNDLGSISFMKGNLDDALHYLNKALEIGEKLPNMENISSLHINIGNIYMKKGLLNEAKQSCLQGRKLSKNQKKTELLQEANVCLNEINKLLIE